MPLSVINNERPHYWWFRDESKLRREFFDAVEELEVCERCGESPDYCDCEFDEEDDDDED